MLRFNFLVHFLYIVHLYMYKTLHVTMWTISAIDGANVFQA